MKLRTNGVELAYSVTGSGPPLVWVAGTGIGGSAWHREQIPAFSSRFTCLTFDLRGTGESDAPTHGYSVASMAEDTVSLVRHVFGDDAVVPMIGLSLGSAIIQEIAISHPEMVSSAVMIGTWSRTSTEHHIRRWFEARLLTLRRAPVEVFRSFAFWMWSPTVIDDEPDRMAELEQFFAEATRRQPLHAYEGHFEADLAHDTYERLERIAAPTLVIYGADDHITLPRYNERVAAAIPQAESMCVPGAGHFVWVERGAEVNAGIADFLSRGSLAPRR